ncbi:hypothetical protein AB205_0218400 [Aquarana catesbeiana]|nr:hypothetical protein AB205_0218400 [Aquarana catesbeiana]
MLKDKIMASVVTALDQKFGIKWAKEQLRKCGLTSKLGSLNNIGE